MGKRDTVTRRPNAGAARPEVGAAAPEAAGSTAAAAMEQRVTAFAEQLGRIAGTLHAKAAGWMDREALNEQIAAVRDGAADLLAQLSRGGVQAPKSETTAAPAAEGSRGRSGGVVDARGKKHRKPMPSDPATNVAKSQAAKVRTARTMVKTNRRRGRG